MELVCLLHIYFIDVLGGAATVIITPQNEVVLVDSGWYTEDGRDAERILQPLQNHNLKQIDYLITTHWHRDHFGAIAEVAEQIPIKHFYDIGIPDEFPDDPKMFPFLIERYKKVTGGKSVVMKAGDIVSLKQTPGKPTLELQCVAANRKVIPSEASECSNTLCELNKPKPRDKSNNADSIALKLSYGDFQFFLGGDITWNIEYALVCPDNRIGEIDLYMVDHHGFEISNNPVFLKSINPNTAVFCNGPRKGCDAKVVEWLRDLPRMQTIYQLHRNVRTSDEENTNPLYIANPDPEKSGEYIKAVVADNTKSYTITIGENEGRRTYLCE